MSAIPEHPLIVAGMVAATLAGIARPVAGAEPLPQPLTLARALALGEGHPRVAQAAAELEAARAGRSMVDADRAAEAGVELTGRWIEPATSSLLQSHNDSLGRIYLRKRLYDFGRTRERLASGAAEVEARSWELAEARNEHRIEVMARFFDVHLADLENARDSEAMAVAFVRLDKGRERHRLQQLSDVVLARLQAEYQRRRQQQRSSEAQQRRSRVELALVLNRPGEVPEELAWPELPALGRALPEPGVWTEEVLAGNPRLRALQARREAARHRLAAARAGRYPVVRGELTAADYNRPTGGRAPLSAGITLDLPLFDGGRSDAEGAAAGAELQRAEAEWDAAALALRGRIGELRAELESLEAEAQALEAEREARELELEEARALYEQEVTTDLGDAMVRISALRLQEARNRFRRALAWARIDALRGRDPGEGVR